MDVDAFTAVRKHRWARLQQLARQRRRTGAEADEMTSLYRSTASDLATVRSVAPDPALITRLSMLLAQSRVWLTGARHVRTSDFGRYFTRSLPAAMYRVRWWGVGMSVIVIALATLCAVYTVNTPAALELVGPPETRLQVAEESFQSYYTEYDGTSFTAQVWTNNALLAVLCIVFGITGLVPLMLMYNTVFQLGIAAAIMAEQGMLDIFFQLIAPHGLLELSAIFVAAGAGLRLFWTMLVPGPRSRGKALAEEGRITLAVALGLTITLFASGLLEGYVTPSTVLPWPVKVGIGVVACVVFWGYIFIVGKEAVRRGASGDDDADFRVEVAPVAA